MGTHVPTSLPTIPTFEYFAGIVDGKFIQLFNQLTGLQINASGNTAGRATHDAEAAGFVYYDSQAGFLYQKQSATSADWSDGLTLVAALQNVVEDTSPVLGGNLDIGAFQIGGNGGNHGIAILSSGFVGIDGITNPQNSLHTPALTVGVADTSIAALGIGEGATGDRTAIIDFNTDTTYTDFSLRIYRNAGANGEAQIWQRGTGDLRLTSNEAGRITFETSATERMAVAANGDVKIGTGVPTTKLDVDGAVRCGTYTVATVPAAATVGAAAMIYVTDDAGGATLAFSDSVNWRRVSDRAIITT